MRKKKIFLIAFIMLVFAIVLVFKISNKRLNITDSSNEINDDNMLEVINDEVKMNLSGSDIPGMSDIENIRNTEYSIEEINEEYIVYDNEGNFIARSYDKELINHLYLND